MKTDDGRCSQCGCNITTVLNSSEAALARIYQTTPAKSGTASDGLVFPDPSAAENLERITGPLCSRCRDGILKQQRKLRMLFHANPDPNQRIDVYSDSPAPILALACQYPWGLEDFIDELLVAGARVHNGLRTSPVFDAVVGNSPAALELLYAHGAQVNPGPLGSQTLSPLHLAAGGWWKRRRTYVRDKIRLEALQWLVQHGADLEARDDYGRTPLHLAAMSRESRAVEILLDHGANLDARDINGRGPLRIAVKTSQPDNAAILLNRGAGDGLDKTQWENLLGMAKTMLHCARDFYNQTQPTSPSQADDGGIYYRPSVQKRRAVYDLLRQYWPAN